MVLKGKRVTVVGLGKSGFAAARFLAARKALVKATDCSKKKEVLENTRRLRGLGVQIETGRHTEAFIAGSDWVVTSPGVPRSSVPLAYAARKKIPVIGEVELAYRYCRGLIIAVTGSNGKTTTSNLIHRILSDAGRKSVLCGNVGYSFLDALSEIDEDTSVVLELSSFQLEETRAFRPRIAVILNIHPNHLDRHRTLADYARAKENIFKRQRKSDTLVLNHDDPVVRNMASRARARVLFYGQRDIVQGLCPERGKIVLKTRTRTRRLLTAGRFKLRGSHNRGNILAAAAAARVLGVPMKKVQRTLDSFETLEHRVEPVGKVAGVRFINDSKSTTVESTEAAIRSLAGPIILIAGGRDKGADFGKLEALLKRRVKRAVIYGEARGKIAAAWKSFRRFQTEPDFREAVKRAFKGAARGDSLLLSPMCTSFDQFSSFEERGEVFKQVFKELKA